MNVTMKMMIIKLTVYNTINLVSVVYVCTLYSKELHNSYTAIKLVLHPRTVHDWESVINA